MQKVAVGIIFQNDTLLLCQRMKGARYELQWEFPGGKIESGESVEQGLRRELHEELSIEAGPVKKIETEISHYDDGSTYEVHYCFLSSFTGTPENNVFQEIRWIKARDLRNYDILQGNRDFVERLLNGAFGKSA